MGRLRRWLLDASGDMVWNALVVITVVLPLLSFSVDVPRYFILRSALKNAVDSAAEAAARSIDVRAWRESGEVRFDHDRALYEAAATFFATSSPLLQRGYVISLDGIELNEADDTTVVRASGTMYTLFPLSPHITVRVEGRSRARIVREP